VTATEGLTAFRRVSVQGLPIDICDPTEVRRIVAGAVRSGAPVRLATVNLHFLRLAACDPAFRADLLAADYRVADGWPVVALARRRGAREAARVTGSDLLPRLCDWAGEEGWRIGFVGAGEDTARVLRTRFADRDWFVGHWTPAYSDEDGLDDPALRAELRAARVDVCCVALGAAKQERWLRRNQEGAGIAFGVGVGASLDFLAGRIRRAPRWMRALRVEFLHRAGAEPRRLLGRYVGDLFHFLRLCAGAGNA